MICSQLVPLACRFNHSDLFSQTLKYPCELYRSRDLYRNETTGWFT
uniref:Uncharacterized protein n=1 Tax=Arundo donax TaxID=35708 RepID=A0A0A9FLM5_ARUDO